MIKFYAIYNIEDELITIIDNYKSLCDFFNKNKNSMKSAISSFKANKIHSIKSNYDGKKYKVYTMEFTEDSYYD